MSGPGREVLRWLTDRYRAGRPLVLLFDFDGTLVPIVEHPKDVRVAPATRQALAELAEQENLFVGVVSSRALADVKEQIGLPDLYYAGSGGLELDLLGIQVVPPYADVSQEMLDEIRERVLPITETTPGGWVERKPFGLTIHYREVAPESKAHFQETVRPILNEWADQLQIWEVAEAFELVPALGVSKATAVERIVEDAARDAVPFYAGDQANDADALTLVRDLGGLAVGIGPNAPVAAEVGLDAPRVLVQVIQRFVETILADEALKAESSGDRTAERDG